MKSIQQWAQEVYALACEKGWYDNPDPKAHCEMACLAVAASCTLDTQTEQIRKGGLCDALIEILPDNGSSLTSDQHIQIARLWLIASEVFEAIESVTSGNEQTHISTKGKPEGLAVELADVAIRLLDFCAAYKIDLESTMIVKHSYNQTRPQRHGGKKV